MRLLGFDGLDNGVSSLAIRVRNRLSRNRLLTPRFCGTIGTIDLVYSQCGRQVVSRCWSCSHFVNRAALVNYLFRRQEHCSWAVTAAPSLKPASEERALGKPYLKELEALAETYSGPLLPMLPPLRGPWQVRPGGP